MNKTTWKSFKEAREEFREMTEQLSQSLPNLQKIQQQFVNSRSSKTASKTSGSNSVYKVETPVVYNTALDDITIDDEIKLILVADNPGRREQAAENKRYLVGPSGKIAAKFFNDNPVLGIDFHKNVIILNKTPIHSPRTIELRELCRLAGDNSITSALETSQRVMAELLIRFHKALSCPVWITGYSEMRKGGLFETYTECLKGLQKDFFKHIFVYRHFSMNQFTIDLKQQALPGENVVKTLKRIGGAYRERVLGRG